MLWKINKEEGDKITSEELTQMDGPVWRVNFSVAGNMLSMSYVDKAGLQFSKVFYVSLNYSGKRAWRLGLDFSY